MKCPFRTVSRGLNVVVVAVTPPGEDTRYETIEPGKLPAWACAPEAVGSVWVERTDNGQRSLWRYSQWDRRSEK